MSTLACIACGTIPEPAMPEDVADHFLADGQPVQPYGATIFISYGQYGSTMFDPCNGMYLEMNICDTCLAAKARLGRIVLVKPKRPLPQPADYERWDPESHQEEHEYQDYQRAEQEHAEQPERHPLPD